MKNYIYITLTLFVVQFSFSQEKTEVITAAVTETISSDVIETVSNENLEDAILVSNTQETPDHNWGGSGSIGLQEMIMQTDNKKIIDLIPENKTVIKFNTTYNQFFTYGKEISKLIEINEPWLKSLENPTTLTLTESQKNVEQEEQYLTKTEEK